MQGMYEVLKTAYKNRIKILAVIFVAAGLILSTASVIPLVNFKYYSNTLDMISIDTLRTGMCIKDDISYTYGNIRAFINGMKTTYVYAVDVGKKHDEYMELIVIPEGRYAGINIKLDDLLTYFPGYYSELKSKKSVEIYGIVEKADKKTFAYEYFSKALGKTVEEMKSQVSTDYVIKTVDLDIYKERLTGGVILTIAGAVVIVYSGWTAKRKEQQDEEKL